MRVGYIRVSTKQQNLGRQKQKMKEQKIDKLFEEQVSGKNIRDRPVFKDMLTFIRQEDTLVVTSLDRLGRNYEDIISTYNELQSRGVRIEVLDAPFLNFNKSNDLLDKALSDMFLSLLSYIAQNERESIRERQRQGIELAKSQGKFQGRKKVYTEDTNDPQKKLIYQQIVSWYIDDVPIRKIAREAGVSRNTVYRILEDMKKEGNDYGRTNNSRGTTKEKESKSK